MLSWLVTTAASKLFNWKVLSIAVILTSFIVAILYLLWDRAELKAEYAELQTYSVALEAANDSHLKTIDAMVQSGAQKEQALAQREKEHQQIQAENDKYRRLLREAYKHDEKARDWAVQPVPPSVLNGLFD